MLAQKIMEAIRPALFCFHRRTTAGGPTTNVISHPNAVRSPKGPVLTNGNIPPRRQNARTNTSVAITERRVTAAIRRRMIRIIKRSSTAGQVTAIPDCGGRMGNLRTACKVGFSASSTIQVADTPFPGTCRVAVPNHRSKGPNTLDCPELYCGPLWARQYKRQGPLGTVSAVDPN
jgi:hypothetical protein